MSVRAALPVFYGDISGQFTVSTQTCFMLSSMFYGDAKVSQKGLGQCYVVNDIDVSVKSLSALISVLRCHHCSMVTLRKVSLLHCQCFVVTLR